MINSSRFVLVMVSILLSFLFLFITMIIDSSILKDIVMPVFTFLTVI